MRMYLRYHYLVNLCCIDHSARALTLKRSLPGGPREPAANYIHSDGNYTIRRTAAKSSPKNDGKSFRGTSKIQPTSQGTLPGRQNPSRHIRGRARIGDEGTRYRGRLHALIACFCSLNGSYHVHIPYDDPTWAFYTSTSTLEQ